MAKRRNKHTLHVELSDMWHDHLTKISKGNYGFRSRLVRSLLERFMRESHQIYAQLGACWCKHRSLGACTTCAAINRLVAGEDIKTILGDYSGTRP